jgi:hypothetical protein
MRLAPPFHSAVFPENLHGWPNFEIEVSDTQPNKAANGQVKNVPFEVCHPEYWYSGVAGEIVPISSAEHLL